MSDRKHPIAWALYDFGNSAFATTVMAGFFPLFFKQFWSAGTDPTESTFRLGVANSGAAIVVAMLAPWLGAIADRGGFKKRFIFVFTALGVVATGLLATVDKGEWSKAVLFYVCAGVGFSGAIVFYDALLVAVARPQDRDRVSALGYGLGYLGGGLLFTVNVGMFLKPYLFGLVGPEMGVRASFVVVALWWALFAIPLFIRVPEPGSEKVTVTRAVREGGPRLLATLRRARELRSVWMFLLAYWLYIDGVHTMIRMAVDYGLSIGLPSSSLIIALLITQFVGFPAAIAFGQIGSRIGTRRGILIGIAVYVFVTIWGYHMDSAAEFYGLAAVIGLVQGGVQALSRSFYSRLVPPEEAAEFFGFYNMLGKFAAVLGPLLMGGVALLTGNPRLSILSLIVLLVAGGVLLLRVPEPREA
jgi:UMF1 family MFS transporter